MIAPANPCPANSLDRFEVVVDPDAEPADLDKDLAEFLLKVVARRHPTAGNAIPSTHEPRIA
jgi:hypothetical protein